MKRILFFLLALVAYGNTLWALDTITAFDLEDVEIRSGSSAWTPVTVKIVDDGPENIIGFEFDIYLPQGIEVESDKDGIIYDMSSNQPADWQGKPLGKSIINVDDGLCLRFVGTNMSNKELNRGDVFTFYIKASDTFQTSGKVLVSGTASNASNIVISTKLGEGTQTKVEQAPFQFSINVVENKIVFEDTKSYEDFKPIEDTNVQVKRAVKADTWNTICLPFAMSADQIAEVFGDDAKVADFTKCETEWTEDDKVIGIKSTFSSVDAMEAHHPYLLKVTNENAKTATEGFTVKGVDIVMIPSLGAQVDLNETNAGTPRNPKYVYDSFIGTYQPITNLGEEKPVAFLSSNKFYYATGSSSLKGFRGYFDFQNLVYYLEDNGLLSNLSFFVDGEEVTSIEGVTTNALPVEGVYDLQGRKVDVGENGINSLQKGIYIVNGKKVTVK